MVTLELIKKTLKVNSCLRNILLDYMLIYEKKILNENEEYRMFLENSTATIFVQVWDITVSSTEVYVVAVTKQGNVDECSFYIDTQEFLDLINTGNTKHLTA